MIELSDFRQKYPLPPDIRYVLDGMLDDQLIDQGSYLALNLFVPRAPILAILDDAVTNTDQLPGITYKIRRQKQAAILDVVDAYLPELPQVICSGLAYCSILWLRKDFHDLANVFALWVHEDETTGGALKAFRERVRIRRNGDVFPRTARRIRSPGYIARYVKHAPESLERRVMATRLLNRIERADPARAGFLDDVVGFLNNAEQELAAQREEARVEALRQFRSGALFAHVRKTLEADVRKHRFHHRAVIKRSLNIARAVLPEEQVRAFIRGEGVRLPGQSMDLLIRPNGSMAEKGHGAIDVKVLAPGSPELLASLCTYIHNTPALDQLAGFALAMQAGEEADIISKANITTLLPAGQAHSLLAERQNRHVTERAQPPPSRPNRRGVWSLADVRDYANAYWEETKHMWVERLSVFACGRRVKMLTADGGA